MKTDLGKVTLSLPEAKDLVRLLEERLGVRVERTAPEYPYSIRIGSLEGLNALNLMRLRLIDCIRMLHPVDVTVSEVSEFWAEQSLVKNFLMENSDELADVEMCRSLPIFIWAEREVGHDLIKAWVADLGFTHLAMLPSLKGSWLGRMFASHSTPMTRKAFWDGISAKDFLEHAGKLSILPVTMTLVGVFVVHQDAVRAASIAAAANAGAKTTQSSTSQTQPAPPTIVKIEVDALKKKVSILTQSKTPEDALKITEVLLKEAQAMQTGSTVAKKHHRSKGTYSAKKEKPAPKLLAQTQTGRKFRE